MSLDLSKVIKQAQQLQKQVEDVQKKLENLVLTGISGGGIVSLELHGNGKIHALSIDPALLKNLVSSSGKEEDLKEDCEILSDLVVAAFNDAYEKLEAKKGEMGDFNSLPFKL